MPVPKMITKKELEVKIKTIALSGVPGPPGPPGADGTTSGNIDGGGPDTDYGGLEVIDCGEI